MKVKDRIIECRQDTSSNITSKLRNSVKLLPQYAKLTVATGDVCVRGEVWPDIVLCCVAEEKVVPTTYTEGQPRDSHAAFHTCCIVEGYLHSSQRRIVIFLTTFRSHHLDCQSICYFFTEPVPFSDTPNPIDYWETLRGVTGAGTESWRLCQKRNESVAHQKLSCRGTKV